MDIAVPLGYLNLQNSTYSYSRGRSEFGRPYRFSVQLATTAVNISPDNGDDIADSSYVDAFVDSYVKEEDNDGNGSSVSKYINLGMESDESRQVSAINDSTSSDYRLNHNKISKRRWIRSNVCDFSTLSVPRTANASVSTSPFMVEQRGMNHSEGGWPADVDSSDPDSTARYCKRLEKHDTYVSSVKFMTAATEEVIDQNLALDLFDEYYQNETSDLFFEKPSAHLLGVFDSVNRLACSVVDINWHPDSGRSIAVAYDIDSPSSCAIWDAHNANFPLLQLQSTLSVIRMEFCNRDFNSVIGGCRRGELCLWDLRTSSRCMETPAGKGHHDSVRDLAWVKSKHLECMSVSTDGQVLWWDTRKMTEPTDRYVLKLGHHSVAVDSGIWNLNQESTLGGTCLSYNESAGPLKFLVGTEQGTVMACEKKAKGASDDRVTSSFSAHYGPVRRVQKHPDSTLSNKYFLTIGDWNARIWNQDIKSHIIATLHRQAYISDGCWSPGRSGTFFTTRRDGVVDAWDLLQSQSDPVLTFSVSEKHNLNCMRLENQNGRLAAFGLSNGSTVIYELSSSLHVPRANERGLTQQILERESSRERYLVELEKYEDSPVNDLVNAPSVDNFNCVLTEGEHVKYGLSSSDYDEMLSRVDTSVARVRDLNASL